MQNRLFLVLLCGAAAVACDRDPPTESRASAAPVIPAPSAVPKAAPSPERTSGARPSAASALSAPELARLFRELSEPDQYFFSDNLISNETSYLQVAPELDRRGRKGGAYIGVGPEQNFSYLALLEPELAFIVDIRRGNAIAHLLYKAIFDRAASRAHFLALLLGRRFDGSLDPGADADLAAVLAAVRRLPAERGHFDESHAQLRGKIEKDYGIALRDEDVRSLHETHRSFFDAGLDLRFELHEKNGRRYPTLSELLAQRDPTGRQRSFLAEEATFRVVQRLQRQHRVIPVVGDFAGAGALAAIAKELVRRDLPVNAFYVSNVEQYLLEPPKWQAWVKNVEALPTDERSIFIRCYLDQGKRHPRQLLGHRTATLVFGFDDFEWRQRKRGYGSFWQVVTDGLDGGAR